MFRIIFRAFKAAVEQDSVVYTQTVFCLGLYSSIGTPSTLLQCHYDKLL